MGNNSQSVRSANGHCPLVWPTLLIILLLFFISAHYRIHAARDANPAFNGYLDLTSAPSVGQTATLTLSLESNLAETAKVEIVFRLPNGVSLQSPPIFSQVYLPAFSFIQRSLLIQVDLPGNYPLQASVYATTRSGRQRPTSLRSRLNIIVAIYNYKRRYRFSKGWLQRG